MNNINEGIMISSDKVFTIHIENDSYNMIKVDLLDTKTFGNLKIQVLESSIEQIISEIKYRGMNFGGMKMMVSKSAFNCIEQQKEKIIIRNENIKEESSSQVKINPICYISSHQLTKHQIDIPLKFKLTGNKEGDYKNIIELNILPKTELLFVFKVSQDE